jgi:hypothetical protein
MQKGLWTREDMVQSMKPRLAVQCLGWIVCLLQDLVVGEFLCVWKVCGIGESRATTRYQARLVMNVPNDMNEFLYGAFRDTRHRKKD